MSTIEPNQTLNTLKTLLVDDDAFIRDSFSLAFRNKGCFMRTAETAEEGLRALESETFHIVISDLKLPGIDGLTFLRQVTTHYPDTVPLLITAHGDKRISAEASSIGVYDCIEKPFSVKTLFESLRNLTGKSS